MNSEYREFKLWWLEKQLSWLEKKSDYFFLTANEEDGGEYIIQIHQEMVKIRKEIEHFKGEVL